MNDNKSQINVRLPNDLVKQLKKKAKEESTTVTTIVKKYIQYGLNSNQKTKLSSCRDSNDFIEIDDDILRDNCTDILARDILDKGLDQACRDISYLISSRLAKYNGKNYEKEEEKFLRKEIEKILAATEYRWIKKENKTNLDILEKYREYICEVIILLFNKEKSFLRKIDYEHDNKSNKNLNDKDQNEYREKIMEKSVQNLILKRKVFDLLNVFSE